MEKAPDLQPTLEGSRVIVRPMIAGDWEHMYAIAADPLLWEHHPANNRYEEAQFREDFEAAMASKSAFTFIEKENGSIIGSSRYHGYDSDKSEIEIGWSSLGRDYWGGHYNGEVKKLMLKHAFKFVETSSFLGRCGQSTFAQGGRENRWQAARWYPAAQTRRRAV